MSAAAMAPSTGDPITDEQIALPPRAVDPKTADEFFRVARWWELEAMRGYPSSNDSLVYATTMSEAGKARLADGTVRPFTPGVDVSCEDVRRKLTTSASFVAAVGREVSNGAGCRCGETHAVVGTSVKCSTRCCTRPGATSG